MVKKSIYEIKYIAREKLRGKYKVPVLTCALELILVALTSYLTVMMFPGDNLTSFFISLGISFLMNLFFIAPITMGVRIISLKIARDEETNVGMVFDGYSYFKKLSVITIVSFVISSVQNIFLLVVEMFTNNLYIINLSLIGITLFLFVILTYLSQTDFILYDENETLSGFRIILKSISIMRKNVLRLIVLNLSFLLWAMLSVITAGLILLWLYPYMNVAIAVFYDDLIKKEEKFEVKIT